MAPDYRISKENAEAFEKFMDTAKFPYEKLEKTASGIIFSSNYVSSDYIQFTKKDGEIANSSIGEFHGGKNWYNQNKEVLKKGLIEQDSAEAMAMYNAIVDAHVNGTKLYHPSKDNPLEKGDVVKESIIKDLYRQFTRDNWQNLNNFFEENENGILVMKKAIGLDEKGELIYSKPEVIDYLDKSSVLVNLKDFNEKGLVTKVSESKNLDRDKNIYYWKPVKNSVSRLNSDFSDPYWDGNDPDNDSSVLRVRESLPSKQ